MTHRFWLPLSAALLVCATTQVWAQAPYGYGPMQPRGPVPGAQRARPGDAAVAVVRTGLEKLFAFLDTDERPNNLQTAAFLDREIAPSFDFAYMAQFVAGSDWGRMNPGQRKDLAGQLESRILSGLATKLDKYDGQQIRFIRARPGKRGSVDVSVGLMSPGAYPSQIVFRLYHAEGGWKVYDVLAQGRSVIAYYREAFSEQTAPRVQGPRGIPSPYRY